MSKTNTLGVTIAAFALAVGSVGVSGARGSDTVDDTATIRTIVRGEAFDAVMFADGRVEYRYHTSLADAAAESSAVLKVESSFEVSLHEGRAVDQDGHLGCEFSGEMSSTAAPGSAEVMFVSREIAFDEATCLMVTEGAWLEMEIATRAGFVDPGSWSSRGTASAAAYEHQGFLRGHTTDPPGIYVAKTISNEQWGWSGSCATSWNRWPSWTPFWPTGWSVHSSSTSYHGSCQPGLEVYGKYRNGTFCLSIDAWTQHTVNFKATGDPASWASWSLSKWGGCSWLLSTGHWYDPY